MKISVYSNAALWISFHYKRWQCDQTWLRTIGTSTSHKYHKIIPAVITIHKNIGGCETLIGTNFSRERCPKLQMPWGMGFSWVSRNWTFYQYCVSHPWSMAYTVYGGIWNCISFKIFTIHHLCPMHKLSNLYQHLLLSSKHPLCFEFRLQLSCTFNSIKQW